MEDTDDTAKTGSALDKKSTIKFEDEFDYKPLKKGAGAGLEDKLFNLFRGKKKVKSQVKLQEKPKLAAIPRVEVASPESTSLFEDATPVKPVNPITGHGIRPEILAMKPAPTDTDRPNQIWSATYQKDMKQKSRFALKPLSTLAINSLVKGLALAVFAAGGFLLYSELPTHPELVIGIVMVSVAGNVIVSR